MMYEGLPEGTIRVLDLLPRSGSTESIPVQQKLVLIANPGDYEALSYTWGSTITGLRQVMCDGRGFGDR